MDNYYEGCTIKEVQAMRDLQNEPFDFGSGLITIDCKESEDAYFKMHLQMFYDWDHYDCSEDNEEIDVFTKDKTRAKRRKGKFRRRHRRNDSQSDCTRKTNQNIRYKSSQGRNWKASDKRRVLYCDLQLDEYNDEESASDYWYWYMYEFNDIIYFHYEEFYEEYLSILSL